MALAHSIGDAVEAAYRRGPVREAQGADERLDGLLLEEISQELLV